MDTNLREAYRQENARQIQMAKLSLTPRAKRLRVRENDQEREYEVTRLGVGPISTPVGDFELLSFEVNDMWKKYSVIFKGVLDDTLNPILRNPDSLLLRIDSGCETGQLFLDQTCECREQLHKAMSEIEKCGEGLVINIPHQDGRGMGLPFKLSTLRLQQELRVDTVQAAAMLEPIRDRDVRTYGGAVAVLQYMGIFPPTEIQLATNNDKKTSIFIENNYKLMTRGIVIEPTKHTLQHLTAKQEILGHHGLVG